MLKPLQAGEKPPNLTLLEKARKAIVKEEIPPSTSKLKKKFYIDYYQAKDILLSLYEEGLLERNEQNHHYKLKNGTTKTTNLRRSR